MTDASDDTKGERIAKRLARAGLCSRREAERWIAEGRVSVDGQKLTSPAISVTETSLITVDGKALPEAERTRLWRYHKPSGLVTSHKDPQGRPTVFERLPEGMPRVISVGRLDLNSEGLLLLTNDGDLARRMELPSTGWIRRYRVRVHGTPSVDELAALERGVTVEGVSYGPIKALLDRQQGSNAWLTVGLKEGKNREIRKVMEHLGWTVSRLIRIAYGPFQLGLLEPNAADEVPARVIQEQLGDKGVGKATAASADSPAKSPSAAQRPARLRSAKPKDDKPGRDATSSPRNRTKPHADRRRPS
jgi:23S rRNA pseudouridine2605 synthase